MASPHRFVFASDAFKGTLSSAQTAALLEDAACARFPDCDCVGVPMADGGTGTVDVLIAACGGEKRNVSVHDPFGRSIRASYGLLSGERAVIEMAAASGDRLPAPKERDPLAATSYGTGELISDALARGCSDITVALGDSVAIDGGMGCMRALGVRFLDEDGSELFGGGRDLARVHSVDLTLFRLYVGTARFRVMCDEKIPLLGPNGAVSSCAGLDGVDPQSVQALERGMESYASVLEGEFSGVGLAGVRDVPGAGAAGGLGAACAAFLSARLESGIESVLDIVGFDELLEGADLCITGEGRFDARSTSGRVVAGVAGACEQHDVPCVAIVGGIGDGASASGVRGLSAVMPAVDAPMSLDEAANRAEDLYARAAERLFALLAVGESYRT